jgi:hypothetical protein
METQLYAMVLRVFWHLLHLNVMEEMMNSGLVMTLLRLWSEREHVDW